MLVKNWTQVYKSLAVWLPILSSGLYVILKDEAFLANVPVEFLPVVVGISGVLGWVKSQKSINKENL